MRLLTNPTIQKLYDMKLKTMANAILEAEPSFYELSFDEQMAILVEKEWMHRKNNRLARLLRSAYFPQSACVEDIDYQYKRAKDKHLILKLAQCNYIEEKLNVIVSGMTGSGKSYLACALGNAACRKEYKTKYIRIPELLIDITHAKIDNNYSRFMKKIKSFSLLIIDDIGLQSYTLEESRDILEIVEAKYNKGSLIMISQLPYTKWYELFPDPTIGDAIMDRISYNSYIFNLETKKSMRQIMAEKKMASLRENLGAD